MGRVAAQAGLSVDRQCIGLSRCIRFVCLIRVRCAFGFARLNGLIGAIRFGCVARSLRFTCIPSPMSIAPHFDLLGRISADPGSPSA